MKRVPTVTVAVCAYNEEQNIEAFLRSVLAQRGEGFTLQHIWVYSDGSSDQTASIVEKLSETYPVIQLTSSRIRVGKSTHLNDIYRRLQSDVLVQSDADVVFSHPFVVNAIVKPFSESEKVWMCGGNPKPFPGITFTEKAEVLTYNVYQPLLRALRDGNNVFSADGRILAYKRGFVKSIRVPSDMIANDVYTYFCCRALGYEYRKIGQAVVYFRCPQTFEDKVKQNMRGAAVGMRMMRYFGQDMVQREYAIPISTRLKSALLQGMKDPIKSCYISAINHYCHLKAKESEKTLTARWPMAWSTKKLQMALS